MLECRGWVPEDGQTEHQRSVCKALRPQPVTGQEVTAAPSLWWKPWELHLHLKGHSLPRSLSSTRCGRLQCPPAVDLLAPCTLLQRVSVSWKQPVSGTITDFNPSCVHISAFEPALWFVSSSYFRSSQGITWQPSKSTARDHQRLRASRQLLHTAVACFLS